MSMLQEALHLTRSTNIEDIRRGNEMLKDKTCLIESKLVLHALKQEENKYIIGILDRVISLFRKDEDEEIDPRFLN